MGKIDYETVKTVSAALLNKKFKEEGTDFKELDDLIKQTLIIDMCIKISDALDFYDDY